MRVTASGSIYRLGLALLDRDDPTKMLARGNEWVLGPHEAYERGGDVPDVVFPCGWVLRDDGDTLHLYYGAADTVVCVAEASLADPARPPRAAPLPARLGRRAAHGDDRAAVTRVAMLAPIAWPTPPRGYGPWEQVVATLTDALVDLGVDVTLYATGNSGTRRRCGWVAPDGYEQDPSYDVKVYEALHIARVFEEAGEYDLVHNHFARVASSPVARTSSSFIVPPKPMTNG